MGKHKGLKFLSKFGVVAVVLFVLLSFNWDRIELESRAFVVTIGIDVAKDDDKPFEVSMNISDTAAMEQGGDENPVVKRNASGESLAHAMGQVEAKISDKIYYGHTKAVVIGAEVLEDSDLLREVIDTLSRKNDINIKCIIMATDKTAAEILAAQPQEQGLLGVYLASFYNSNNANTASSVVKLDLEGLIVSLRAGQSAVIPKITLEGEGDEEEVTIGGVAVVRDFARVGYIDEEDMRGFLWLTENGAGTQIAIETESGHTTMLTSKSRARMDFYEEGGRLHCLARLNVEGSIEGALFMEEQLFDADNLAALEERFAGKIQGEMEDIFRILQKDFAVDGFGLKEKLRKKQWGLYQKYEEDWPLAYDEMIFVARVDLTIRNTGAVK
ncbi:MAG: Ger(x)C family spore germination protein [Defluviitaleaceae bacterium]|nr:Ger(x)C family spore germination protein [Defluviitaleaceae bacterium]